MGLTYQDLENLNQSMSGLGNAFVERRKEAQRQQQLDIEKSMRERQLGVEERRLTAEEGRQRTLAQREQDQSNQKDDEMFLHSVLTANAEGQLDEEGRKGINEKLAAHPRLSKIGIHLVAPPAKAGFQTAPTRNKQAWDAEMKKADDLEAQAKSESDATSVDRQMMLEQAKKVRENANRFYLPKEQQDPNELTREDITKPDALKPEVSTTETHLRGRASSPQWTNQPAATRPQGKPITDKQGKKWLYKGSMADPTKDKDPKNWVAQ